MQPMAVMASIHSRSATVGVVLPGFVGGAFGIGADILASRFVTMTARLAAW